MKIQKTVCRVNSIVKKKIEKKIAKRMHQNLNAYSVRLLKQFSHQVLNQMRK